MIDLHTHTTYSDGTDTVKQILEKAQNLNLKYLAITDHDNCDAHIEMQNMDISKHFEGKVVPGIEIKCSYRQRLIEVLGYKFDIKQMKQWADEYYKDKSREKLQLKYFMDLYNKCIKIGLVLPKLKNIVFNPKKEWASVVIYNELKKNSRNFNKVPQDFFSSFDIFSKKYCGDTKGPLFIDKTQDYPTVQEAINAIRQCNGLVFLPHVYIYKWIEDIDSHIKILNEKYKIDGIECFHSEFSQGEIQHLLEFCKINKFLISGGSDYHGENKPKIELGIGKENLKIEEEYVENWI